LILLVGASISYYHQHPERLNRIEETGRMSVRLRERLALQLMQLLARDHEAPGEEAGDAASLAGRLKVTEDQIRRTLDTLLAAGLVVRTDDVKRRYLPAKSIDRILLIDIIEAARGADDNGMHEEIQQDAALGELLRDIDACREQVLHDKTLKQLV
jgi:membrane protein